MAKEKDEKKIIVDEDWKQQAQDMKEKDVKAEEKIAAEPQAGERQLPPGDFAGLVNILVSQSLFLLGLLVEKGQEQGREPDLPLAKYHIDMLGALEEKTKGNLTEEEDKMIQSVLQQLRMAFVELSSKAGNEPQ